MTATIPTDDQLAAMETSSPMLVAEVRRLRAELDLSRKCHAEASEQRDVAQRGCTTLSAQLNDTNIQLLRRTSTLDRLKGACMASVRAAGGTIDNTSSGPTPTPDDVATAVTVLIANLSAHGKTADALKTKVVALEDDAHSAVFTDTPENAARIRELLHNIPIPLQHRRAEVDGAEYRAVINDDLETVNTWLGALRKAWL